MVKVVMVKVEFIVNTAYRKKGQVLDVYEFVAKELVRDGIAKILKNDE